MKIMKIPFFDYPRLFLDKKDDYMNIFSEVASRGAFIMQSDVDIFEKKIINVLIIKICNWCR